MSQEEKICARCKLPKPLDQFYDTQKGKGYWCKKCNLDAAKELYKKRCEEDPEFSKRRYLKYQKNLSKDTLKVNRIRYIYGLTEAQCERIIERQGGVCPVCKLPVTEGKRVVDHNHETGKVRGILHHKCNMGIGFFGDSVKRLRAAMEYLERDGIELNADETGHYFRLNRGARSKSSQGLCLQSQLT